jgi:hypothetical protein
MSWTRLKTLAAAFIAAALVGCETVELPPLPPVSPPQPPAPTFTYHQVGSLLPGTGQGAVDSTVYAPGIVFPIRSAPAFLNSQVHNPGGGPVGGDQCAVNNFRYPWRDTFCEARSADRGSLNCPSRRIHQGVDIRAGDSALCASMRSRPSPEHREIEVVAVDAGVVSHIGSFSVEIRSGPRIYRYLHLNPNAIRVRLGEPVFKGQPIGFLSNWFNGTPTTLHLHFEIKQNIDGVGFTWVNPYMSLVEAYERRERGRGQVVTGP